MKNKNEEGLVFRAVEIVLMPLAVAVRLQVALIRQTLYVAFVMDRIIAKSKFPRIRFKWKKDENDKKQKQKSQNSGR